MVILLRAAKSPSEPDILVCTTFTLLKQIVEHIQQLRSTVGGRKNPPTKTVIHDCLLKPSEPNKLLVLSRKQQLEPHRNYCL